MGFRPRVLTTGVMVMEVRGQSAPLIRPHIVVQRYIALDVASLDGVPFGSASKDVAPLCYGSAVYGIGTTHSLSLATCYKVLYLYHKPNVL